MVYALWFLERGKGAGGVEGGRKGEVGREGERGEGTWKLIQGFARIQSYEDGSHVLTDLRIGGWKSSLILRLILHKTNLYNTFLASLG